MMLENATRSIASLPVHVRRHPRRLRIDIGLLLGLGVVVFVASAGILLTTQGWRSRGPAFDLLTYIYAARDLVANGSIPRHGDTGSYGSMKPPGTAWLMLPSALLFSDPRLSEYTGTAILHLFTLFGLFFMARAYLGTLCASVSVVLYGLSSHGLFEAGSLWPNGRPDFYIWFVLLASLWVMRRRARFLAGAIVVLATGMQVDMALTPAILVVPVLWLLYRPPVRLRPVAIAGIVVLAIWSPYLTFEAPRAFADIRSQLLLQHIPLDDFRSSWCDPSLTLQTSSDSPESELASVPGGSPAATDGDPPGILSRITSGGAALETKLLSNFTEATRIPGANFVLWLMCVCSLALLSAPVAGNSIRVRLLRRADWPRLLACATALLAAVGLVWLAASSFFGVDARVGPVAISTVRRLVALALTASLLLAAGAWLLTLADFVLMRRAGWTRAPERIKQAQVLALSLVVPWLILVAVAEPGKPERFWWLFPMQAVFVAALFTTILPMLHVRRSVVVAGLALVAFVLVGNGFLLSRLSDWREFGWDGRDVDRVQVAAFVANQLGPDRHQAAIGYRVFVYPFMPNYNITNPIYKAGADIDVLFRYLYGINNTDTCAEGFAPRDEFRIVEATPSPQPQAPKDSFNVPLSGQFRLLQQIGNYQIWRRI